MGPARSFSYSRQLTSIRWIANRINEVLGTHDDVVIDYTFELIEGARSVRPSPTASETI